MENQIISGLVIVFIIIQLAALLVGNKWKRKTIKAYELSIFSVCLYNINLMFMVSNLNDVIEIITRQLLPILSLLVFKSFYVEYYKTIEKKFKHTLGYFFVYLLPIVVGFILAIDLLRMILNSELVVPGVDPFHKALVVSIVLYQIFVLSSFLVSNYKLYKASLARYGQVYLAHILVNGIYIVLTLMLLVLNKIESDVLVTGILFSLYVAFLVVNCVRKEWLPRASTKTMDFKEPIRGVVETVEHNKDRRALDSLTGVFTRTYFFNHLDALEVNDESLAIVLMDVSGLKLINESFGYHIGDDILLEMSVALSDTFTKGSIARISGRIFAVLISGESEEGLCDNIRTISSMADEKHSLDVQLNFGYYIRGPRDISALDVYKRAEEELYYNRMLVNQKHQKKLAFMLYNNFKRFLPSLTNHLKSCSDIAVDFGYFLKLEKTLIEDLENAALLHDIALVRIPDVVDLEMVFIDEFHAKSYKNHVQKGYEISIETGLNQNVASIILHHHERYDGSGFPGQLIGEQIHPLAQILSMVDFVDVYFDQNKTIDGIEEVLKTKIDVAFSKEMVYNMIAFLKAYSIKGENYEYD